MLFFLESRNKRKVTKSLQQQRCLTLNCEVSPRWTISNRSDTSYKIHEQSFTQEVQCGHYSIKRERERERDRKRTFPRVGKNITISTSNLEVSKYFRFVFSRYVDSLRYKRFR